MDMWNKSRFLILLHHLIPPGATGHKEACRKAFSPSAGWPSATFDICRCANIHRPDAFLMRERLEKGWRFIVNILKELDCLNLEEKP